MTTRRNFTLGIAALAGAGCTVDAGSPRAAAGGGARAAGAAAGAGGSPMQATQMIDQWPDTAQKSARKMIDKYGPPHEATPTRLIWHDNGPWKRTIVTKEETDHNFPMPHKDVMEQFVGYRVPPEKFDELAQFDGSVIVERTKGEMSARCDKEEANFLALNLANDIVQGKTSVQMARRQYGEAIKAMMKGEKPAYTQKLQFSPMQAAADPDTTTIEMAAAGASKKE